LRTVLIAAALLMGGGRSQALAWGCDAHRAIAIVTAQLLGSTAVQVRAALAASPIDPRLDRFCAPVPDDILADVSTWADDIRAVEPSTAPWHFINFPRSLGARISTHQRFCPGGACVVDAVVRQFDVLRTAGDRNLRASALRYIIHLIGDVHQPLHAITNGDRGGNCLPIAYFGQPPQQDANGNFTPNLHRVWDNDLIRTLMKARGLADARALAGSIASTGLPQNVPAEIPTTARVRSWARGSNTVARTVAYGRLPVNPPIESAAASRLLSCDENDHVGMRMAALHEAIGPQYEQASAPAIISQLRLAAVRLAAVLKAAFPER
jgi:hypothetical protein